jgi:hypothetical protein
MSGKTHGELVAAGLRDENDLRGLISESFNCIDCGYNTAPGNLNRAESEQEYARQTAAGIKKQKQSVTVTHDHRSETYIVHEHVWKRAGMAGGYSGCLCIGCLEKRIGRPLRPEDFPDHVFNTRLPGTPRLLERQGRHDPLGEWKAAS